MCGKNVYFMTLSGLKLSGKGQKLIPVELSDA